MFEDYVAVVDLVVSISARSPLLAFVAISLPFEVVSEGWILRVGYLFELSIRIEEEYGTKSVVDEADHCLINSILATIVEGCVGRLILDGLHEEYQKSNREKNTYEYVNHDYLVAEVVLDGVEKEKEEYAKDGLPQEVRVVHKVQHHDNQLKDQEQFYYLDIQLSCTRLRFLRPTKTHLSYYNRAAFVDMEVKY